MSHLPLKFPVLSILPCLVFLSWVNLRILQNIKWHSTSDEFTPKTSQYYENSTLKLGDLISSIPTVENPFVFFHQRKAGGSTFKGIVERAANHWNGTTFIACVTTSCETYYTPQNSDFNPIPTIYGGHFHYSSFLKTLYLLHNNPHHVALVEPPLLPSRESNFTCFTGFRNPVSRIHSCWNYRMVQNNAHAIEYNVSTLESITNPVELEAALTTAMSEYGEGCLNEPMRVFSDFGYDESIVNKLHQHVSPEYHQQEGSNNNIAALAVNQTISRLSSCVVGILDRCHDTKAAIAKHLPWLAPYYSCDDDHNDNNNEHLNVGLVSKGELTHEQVQVIQRLARYEEDVYQQANKMLDDLIIA